MYTVESMGEQKTLHEQASHTTIFFKFSHSLRICFLSGMFSAWKAHSFAKLFL